MCHDSDSYAAPCNRQPFQSESGCDRGSVDIHQFEDLPYCGPISPAKPKVPPEVDDAPVPIPLPTYTCTCVNIDHEFKLRYNKDRAFSTSTSFRAKGDCCEGAYEAKFDLKIPCPVIGKSGSEGRKLKLGIAYGNGPQSASASFISANSGNCTIEALAPSISLNIPCPIPSDAGGKIKVGIAYGGGAQSVAAPFIETNHDNCVIEPLNPTLNLNIPCPLSFAACRVRTNADAGVRDIWSGKFYSMEKITQVWSEDGKELYWKIRQGNVLTTVATFSPKSDDAGVKFGLTSHNRHFDMVQDGKTVKPYQFKDMEGDDACHTKGLKFKVKYTSDGKNPSSYSYITKDGGCDFVIQPQIVNLNIPCSIKGDDGVKKIKASIAYGDGSTTASASYMATDLENCTIEPQSPELKLNIPCPLNTLFFSVNTITQYTDVGALNITGGDNQGSCAREFNISAVFPLGDGFTGRQKVVEDIFYRNHTLTMCFGYLKYKHGRYQGYDSGACVTLFNAVPHGDCC